MEPWKDSCCSRTECISGDWRSGQKTLDMHVSKLCVKTLSLKTFIPNFVAFFVSSGIVIS